MTPERSGNGEARPRTGVIRARMDSVGE